MSAPPDEVREAFLAQTRICVLTTFDQSGRPVPVPVWFEWDGVKARIFTNAASPKVANLERDPRATLLVINNVGEQEYWVRMEGTMTIHRQGAAELAERLASRYWDMSREDHQRSVRAWLDSSEQLRLLEISPTSLRTYRG